MTNLKNELNENEKIIYLKALAYTLNIDKRDTVERECYLEMKAHEIGYNIKDIKGFKKSKKPAEVIKDLQTIVSIRMRRYILREMIMLAIADHEVSDTEMSTIYNIGISIGIKEEKINDFFLWAAQGIEWQMEGRCLVEEDL